MSSSIRKKLDDLRSHRCQLPHWRKVGRYKRPRLQRYLQIEIIEKMSAALNHILEEYRLPPPVGPPGSSLTQFRKENQIHVLSEFSEK